MTHKKRSPIKEAPLPLAGQSLRERRNRIWESRIEAPLYFAAATSVIALLEWLRVVFPAPPQQWPLTVLATGAIGFLVWRLRKAVPAIRRLKLAEEGERAVGQELEKIREQGYEIFHDVPGPGFNVDHVLVGPAGLVCVETKTWSKSASSEAKIAFDGNMVTVLPTGWQPARDPVKQARALSDWVGDLIKRSTGRELHVRPVVLFPGWWVEQGKATTREVWVLEPKALGAFLARDSHRLSREEIKMASFHLTQYIRARLREQDDD